MVKYSTCKTRLSHSFKNLSAVDTILRIDKQGKCITVTLEQKILSCLLRIALHFFVGAVLFYLLTHFLVLSGVYVTKYITAIFVILLVYQFMGVVREESLLMVHSLGFQLTAKYVVGQRDLFIPWNQVQNIFINEVIIRHKVIHVLTILTKEAGSEKLIPLFLEMQPRLKHLELIYKHLKGTNS